MRILDLIDLNRGDTLKQGDSTRLRFQLSAKDYLLPDNEGKQARIVFIFNNSIIHEEYSTVQRGNVVEFSINEILPENVYILEIHVDGQIFPSDEYIFKIKWSAAGIDHEITKSYGINNIIERAVDLVSAKFVNLTKEKLGLGNVINIKQASEKEVSQARGSYPTLDSRLDASDDILTSTTTQLAQKANSSHVDNLETIVNNMVISNDLSPNKDPEVVGARLGHPTLAGKIEDMEKRQSITNDILINKAVFNDFTGIEGTNGTSINQTRIINKPLPKNTLLMSVTVEAIEAGSIKLKYVNKNADETFSLIKDIATITVTPGLNTFNLNYITPLDGYIGIYSEDATIGAYSDSGMSYVFNGDLVEKSSVTMSSFNICLSLMVGEPTTKIEKELNQTIQTKIKSLEEKVGETTTYNDYSTLSLDHKINSIATRIINEEITSPTTLTEINISASSSGDALIKIFKKVGELTFDLVEEFPVQLDVGDNVIDVNNQLVEGTYIGVYPITSKIQSKVGVGTPSLFLEGDIKGDGNKFKPTTTILGVSFKTFTLKSNLSTHIPYDYSRNLMQLFPTYTTVGDSLTAGFTSVDGTGSGSAAAAQTKNNWPGFLSLRTGRTFNNIAVGGSTSKDWRNTHLQTGNIPTDCYIVALGVNDARKGLAVGSPSDIASDKNLNADTFYGNYDFVVRGLLDFNPTKEMFVLTIPAHESNAETYNVAIRYIAGLYENVHLIDMYNIYYDEYTSGFLPNNYINAHYTPLSYNYISTMIERAINEYLFDNFEYFQKVPYE